MSYIVPKEMPECCAHCKSARWSIKHQTAMCKWLDDNPCFEDFSKEYRTKRSELCPLTEVKTPHGRLIDADALKSKFSHGDGDSDVDSAWISTIRRLITQADTIIEAEGVEE